MGIASVRRGIAAAVRQYGRRVAALFTTFLMFAASSAHAATTPGTMPGSFSVSHVGAATYQIPIDLPPGVNKLQPSLALLYNSQGSNGLLGQGWSLTGLSVITRCPKTVAQDNTSHLPDLTANDRFCLDGQRLKKVSTGDNYGDDLSVYHTEIESFQQVTAHGTAGNGPSYFEVAERSGIMRYYKKILVSGDHATALMWLVSKITDQYGNFINFTYTVNAAGTPPFDAGTWQSISEIDYGGAGQTVGSVVFGYGGTPRQDIIDQSYAGTYVRLNATLLKTITVQDGRGNPLRSYSMNYTAGRPTQLASIMQCTSNPGTGTCYPATTFDYSASATSFNIGGDSLGGGLGMGSTQILDLDGDGLPDYIFTLNNAIYVALGKDYNNPITTSVPVADRSHVGIGLGGSVVMDIDGDGKQELLVPYFEYPNADPPFNNPYWRVLSWNGSHLVMNDPPVNGCTTGSDCMPVCSPWNAAGCYVDGVAVDPGHRGRSGLLFVSGGKLFYYANSNGSFGDANGNPVATGLTAPDVNGGPPALVPMAYSGNGKSETYVTGTGVVDWTGSAFEYEAYGDFDDANMETHFVDAFGDGHSSVAVRTNDSWVTFPNYGSGFTFLSQIQNNFPCASSPTGADYTQILTIDWYHDGRQELILPANHGSTKSWWIFDVGSCSFSDTGAVLATSDQGHSQLVDVNDDGQMDIMYTYGTGHTAFAYNAGQPTMLDEVVDGLGHHIDVGYSSLGQATRGVSAAAPALVDAPEIRPYVGPMYVVKDFATDSGTFDSSGNPQQIFTYYLYGGASIDVWGRGFLGFSKVQAINYNSDLYNTDTYYQNFPFMGMVATSTKAVLAAAPTLKSANPGKSGVKVNCSPTNTGEPNCTINNPPAAPQATFVTGGITVSKTTMLYGNYDPNTLAMPAFQPYGSVGVYYAPTYSSTTDLYDINTGDKYETTTTQYTYTRVATNSSIGVDMMPTEVLVTTTDAKHQSKTASVDTITTYADSASAYSIVSDMATKLGAQTQIGCPARPAVVKVTSSYLTQAAQPKLETFAYDDHCFLTGDGKTVFDPAGIVPSMDLVKNYSRDDFGNITSSTVSGDNIASRTSSMSYDQSQRFPVTVTNTLNQTEILVYDSWGHKTSDTDANGDTVTYQYFTTGRVHKQSGPRPGVYTTWDYAACDASCTPNAVMTVTQTGSDGSKSVVESDQLGRSLRTYHYGFGGVNDLIYQETVYDMLGRVKKASIPHRSSTANCWDTKKYDVLDRVISETQPYGMGANETCATSRTVTAKYTEFQTTKAITGGINTNDAVQETTTSILNVLGKPASTTDAKGAITVFDYDPWGNPISVTPPDSATVSMTYDSVGEKLSMSDPDMGNWSYRYDVLGELLNQTDAKGQTVTNEYDLLGRMTSRVEPEGKTIWKYDVAYGAGVGRLSYTMGPLDAQGNLTANGTWEGFAYDAYGVVTDKITVVKGQEYWVTTDYDDQGRVSQVVYPDLNGINVNSQPADPAGLTASIDANDAGQVDLAWTLAQAGQMYHLYRTAADATSFQSSDEIYTGPLSSWPDSTITKSGTYKWWLQACNVQSCSNGYATVTQQVILPPTVPGIPQVPTSGTQTSQNWSVNWLASSLGDTGTPGPITYNLQVSTDGHTYSPAYSGVGTPVFDGTSVSAGVGGPDGTYYYRVQACASGGSPCSVFSPASLGYTVYILPTVPRSASAPGTATGPIHVTWSAPATNGGNVTYKVSITTTKTTQWGQIPVTTYDTTTNLYYDDPEDTDGSYSYQVVACNTHDTTNMCSDSVDAGTTLLTLPPSVPGQAHVPGTGDTHNTGWNINWGAATLNSGSTYGIVYDVYESENSGNYTRVVIGNATTSVFIDGHTDNAAYTYKVKACTVDSAVSNTRACSDFGAQSGAYTTVLLPPLPSNISLPGSVNLDGSFTASWTENAQGITVTSYNAVSGTQTGSDPIIWHLGGCSGPAKSCTFTGQAAGTRYVRVQACDTDDVCTGWVNSTDSVEGGATPPPTLTLPTTTTTGTATLTWTAVTPVAGAIDYTLYKASKTSAGWSDYAPTDMGTTRSNAVSLSATTTAKRYYVVACDSATCTNASAVSTISYVAPAVVHLTGTGNAGVYDLSWTASTGATSYELHKITYNSVTGVWSADKLAYSGTARTYEDHVGALVSEVQYYAYACNAIDCSARSNTLDFDNNLCGINCTSSITPPPGGGGDTPPILLAEALPAGPVLDALPGLKRSPVLEVPMPASLYVADLPVITGNEPVATVVWVQVQAPAANDPSLMADAVSARQSFFLSQAYRKVPDSAGARYAKLAKSGKTRFAHAADPHLSLYPPLRRDPRVQAHFEAMGGLLPAQFRKASCGDADTGANCSEPATTTALMVGYEYSTTGSLVRVDKLDDTTGQPSKVIWEANDATTSGQVDQESWDEACDGQGNCNGAATFTQASTYDGATGLLTGTTSSAVGAAMGVTAAYTWDGYNDLMERSVSESGQNASPSLDETFSYDELNRLRSSTTNAAGFPVDSGTYDYDVVGNFNTKGGYTLYHYTNTAQQLTDGTVCTAGHPHAVSDVTVPGGALRNFCYDANGNLVEEWGDVTRTVTWTSYNKPSQITGNGAEEDFVYGPGRERLVTTLHKASGGAVTTVYIDGLFESVYDSTSDTYSYRHYVSAGGTRVAVETLQANSSGQQTADTFTFYVHDEIGSVIAQVTENEDSTNQQMTLLSYDAWGKARPVQGGTGVYVSPAAGTFLNPTISGQHEGFGGHENLDDVGLVEMEGRIYDPEVGRFLSPDPNVQYPDSSQGYNRYTYVNNNPLSLSDPSGYFADSVNQDLGIVAAIVVTVLCEGTCGGAVAAAFLAGAADGFVASGGNIQQAEISGVESMAFAYVGGQFAGVDGSDPVGMKLFERSMTEGLMAGVFSEAGGGSFGDGFVGAFVASESGGYVSQIGGKRTDPLYHSALNITKRVLVTAIVGGAASELTGGNFGNGALAAAFQRLFNEEEDHSSKGTLTISKDGAPDYFPGAVNDSINYLASTGFNVVDTVLNLGVDLQIVYTSEAYADHFDCCTMDSARRPLATIYWNPKSALFLSTGRQSAAMGLFHEVAHIFRLATNIDKQTKGPLPPEKEDNLVQTQETKEASALGEPTRNTILDGHPVNVINPLTHDDPHPP